MNESGTPIGFDETPPEEQEVSMKKMETIQQTHGLNDVFALDAPGPGGARHHYIIVPHSIVDEKTNQEDLMLGDVSPFAGEVFFHGPRNESGSAFGVTDADLLEIVRDRLTDFQAGPYPSPETADALRYVNEALICLNRRTQDRAQRGVLGRNTP